MYLIDTLFDFYTIYKKSSIRLALLFFFRFYANENRLYYSTIGWILLIQVLFYSARLF